MHDYAIKSSTFAKLGDFSLKYQNFSKFSAPAAQKSGHWTQFFPKFSQSSDFRRLRCRKSGHWTAKVTHFLRGHPPPYSSPDSHPKPKKAVFSTQSPSLVSDVSRCFLHRIFCPIFLFQSIVFLDGKFKVLEIFDGKSLSYDRISQTQSDRLSYFLIWSIFSHPYFLSFVKYPAELWFLKYKISISGQFRV